MERESIDIQRVIYRLSKEDTRKAILNWITENAAARSFLPETEVVLFGNGQATVLTDFSKSP